MHGYEGRVPLSIYPYILGSAIIFFVILCAVGIYRDRNRMYPQNLLLRCLALFLFILEPFLSILHVMNIMYSPLLEKIGVVCYGLGTIGYGYEMKNRQKYLKPNCSLTKHEIVVMKGYKALIIAGIMVIFIGNLPADGPGACHEDHSRRAGIHRHHGNCRNRDKPLSLQGSNGHCSEAHSRR